MKKTKALLATLTIALSLIVSAIPAYAATDTPQEVIYRMYNPNTGEHLYTSSPAERSYLYVAGWDAENIGWVAPQSSNTPIYRLYNGFEHFYTTQAAEADYLTSLGWSNEGIKFYSDDEMAVPMYRLFNPAGGAGSHHYTTSGGEKDMLIGAGWSYEGIAWYTLFVDTSTIPLPDLPERFANNVKSVGSFSAIEADVKLSGWGTGNHAKLLYQTPTAAVSFGIQYDSCAVFPYTGQTFYLCENVASNDPGAQRYFYYDVTNKDVYHHLMMTYDLGGIVSFYVDGNMVGQVWNPSLDAGDLYVSVEGSARLDGDTVDATFRNIRIRNNWTYNESERWPTYPVITNPGIGIDKSGFDDSSPSTGQVHIAGTIVGLGGLDWDSAYDRVSGVMRLSNKLK